MTTSLQSLPMKALAAPIIQLPQVPITHAVGIDKPKRQKGVLGSTRDKNGVEINNKKRTSKSKPAKQNASQQELF